MEHEELEYIPRKIGESWSCYWNTYKPNRLPLKSTHSEWQSFFTPPYTPKTEVSPTVSSDRSSHSSNDINLFHNGYSKESTISSSSIDIARSNSTNPTLHVLEKTNIELENSDSDLLLGHINDEKTMDIDNLLLGTAENVQSNLESTNLIPNSKNSDAGVPTIISIEKTNLVGVKSLRASQKSNRNSTTQVTSNVSVCGQSSKENTVKLSRNQKIVSENKAEKIKAKNSIATEVKDSNSSLVKVKTVKIEGIPNVTVTYEIPTFLQENNEVIKKCEEVKPNTELEITEKTETGKTIQSLSKKSIMTSKMYEKFSFSKLRKAKSLQKNNIDEAKDASNKEMCLAIKTPIVKKEVNSVFQNKTSEPVSVAIKSSSTNHNLLPDITKTDCQIPTSNNETFESINQADNNINTSIESDTSKDIGNSDIDAFLNEFIDENNVNSLPNVDDWLSSFFLT